MEHALIGLGRHRLDVGATGSSYASSMLADGRYVTFSSYANNRGDAFSDW